MKQGVGEPAAKYWDSFSGADTTSIGGTVSFLIVGNLKLTATTSLTRLHRLVSVHDDAAPLQDQALGRIALARGFERGSREGNAAIGRERSKHLGPTSRVALLVELHDSKSHLLIQPVHSGSGPSLR